MRLSTIVPVSLPHFSDLPFLSTLEAFSAAVCRTVLSFVMARKGYSAGVMVLACLALAALAEALLPGLSVGAFMPENLLGGLDPSSLDFLVHRPLA